MATFEAKALTADWLNAWVAAIGICVLLPETKLAWSSSETPHAIFTFADHTPFPEQLAKALPSLEDIGRLAIARTHSDSPVDFARKVAHEAYRARCELVRRTGDSSLSSSVTDLGRNHVDDLDHGTFDPPQPGGITLWQRVGKCVSFTDPDPAALALAVERTLRSGGERVDNNGLGWDYRRILSPTNPKSGVWVDPIVELLTFYGMTLLPTRGDGRVQRTRGFTAAPSKVGSFTWTAWTPPLSATGIDALLDQFWAGRNKRPSGLFPVSYESVPYDPRGSSDVTRGYASRRMV
jgi:hypothetical protein